MMTRIGTALAALCLTAAAPVGLDGPLADLDKAPAEVPDIIPDYEIVDNAALPLAVSAMRDRLIAAAKTGDIDALRAVIEENGVTPAFSFEGGDDPIEHWRRASGDEAGREILAILQETLETAPVLHDAGSPDAYYGWPYFEALDLTTLTPEQEVELYTLVTSGDVEVMIERGGWSFFRVHITPDGVWRAFIADE